MLEKACKLESPCRVCARFCGARRAEGETGFCGARRNPRVTKFFITHGEEACLNPAYMLYFAYCNMRCSYCSNAEFIVPDFAGGAELQAQKYAERIDRAYLAGQIRVLQLLGGEPSGALSGCIEVLRRLQTPVPVVWNSNFYFSAAVRDILAEFVDLWVADLKFGNDRCALHEAETPDYWETVTANLRAVPQEQLLIRHLRLGGHRACCTAPVLELLAREFAAVPVSFHPLLPDAPGWCRKPDAADDAWLEREVARLGLKHLRAELDDNGDGAEPEPYFSGEILIRRDGSILVQDVPEPVRELLRSLLGDHKSGDDHGDDTAKL